MPTPPEPADTFTTADIFKAVATLRAANVPPVQCPNCKTGYYIQPPRDWKPGDSIKLRCYNLLFDEHGNITGDSGCGQEWTMGTDPKKKADVAGMFVAEKKP